MKLAIIGHGGHSKVIQDIVHSNNEYEIIGYFDDKYKETFCRNEVFYGPMLSALSVMESLHTIKLVIAIGDNQVRKRIVQKLNLPAEQYATLVHRSASVSPSAVIEHGTVIMPHVVINADTKVGCHSIINTSSVIEHDSRVGNFVHVSPRVVLTGAVHLEEGVFVGAGAAIIPQVHIGLWSTVGAGATVLNDIPAFSTAVGIPAKVKIKQVNGGM